MSTQTEKPDRAADIMRETARKLCEMIEQGQGDPAQWAKSWRKVTHSLAGAVNVATHRHYTGGNAWMLALTEMVGEHVGPWGTYKQWQSVGATVRKGEKSTTYVLVPKTYKRETTADERARYVATDREAPDSVSRTMFGAAAVFGADQVDGWTGAVDLMPGDATDAQRWTTDVVQAGNVRLLPGEPKCAPVQGIVYMPPADAFDSVAAYLCTFWHELTHWTSERVGRVRDAKRWGDKGYAAEELVAEMGAAIVAARHGLSAEPRPDHLHYLASWYRLLKDDPSRLWTAGKLAEQAAGYLFGLVPLDETDATALDSANVAVAA